MMNRPHAIRLASFLPALLLAACGLDDGGTEIPNEVKGRTLTAQGPAANARVSLVPIGHVPGDLHADSLGHLIRVTETDAEGRFAFTDVEKGRYNVIASGAGLESFRDSVAVSGAVALPADTLTRPGDLVGEVLLQPQHNPRTAVVQVLGTQVFVNVGAGGRFRLHGLGAGQYRLRVATTEPGYVPLFEEVTVRSGVTDTLRDPLEPFFGDIPVVRGVKAVPGPDGTVALSWSPSDYWSLHSYVVVRESAGAVTPVPVVVGRTSDTVFVDTVFSRNPGPGQYSAHDTVPIAFEYRVLVRSQSGTTGPSFGIVAATAVPPSLTGGAGLWKPVAADHPFTRWDAPSLVAARGKLWFLGGVNGGKVNRELWSSPDGESWERVNASLPFPDMEGNVHAVAFRDSLFAVKAIPFRRTTQESWGEFSWTHLRLQAWISGDGVAWRKVTDSLPFAPRTEFELVADSAGLMILAGYGEGSGPRIWHSADGTTFSPFVGGAGPKGQLVAGSMGASIFALDSAGNVWRTTARGSWSRVHAGRAGFPPYWSPTLTAHDDKLWLFGGPFGFDGFAGWEVQSNKVQTSPDGSTWTTVDANAPFGVRTRPAAASFKGRLWIMGGTATGAGSTKDIWYLE